MNATAAAERPPWADCVVLECTRCHVRVKVSWEVFAEASQYVYLASDMPQRTLLPYACHRCNGRSPNEELHFVDLDTSRLQKPKPTNAHLRGARLCGCRECKRR